MNKKFGLAAHEIAPIAMGHGGCIATDRIVVDGRAVGYMSRDEPINEQDSGWRFVAGDEDEEYMADMQHHGVYDVNTIVNYDPDVLPFLSAPVGSRIARTEGGTLQFLADDE
jgi:hypothetical protein